MDQIKILHFIGALQGGGAETQLNYLINNIDSDKYINAICCINSKGAENYHNNVEIFEIKKRHIFDQRWIALHSLIKSWQPDIIHNWLPAVMPSSILPAKLYHKSVYLASYRSAYRLNNPKRLIQSCLFLLADKIVSNTSHDDMYAPFKSIFSLKKGEIIFNGFDTEKILNCSPISLKEPGIDPDTFTLLFVGRLIADKNIPVIIEAIHTLKKQGMKVQLIIAGKGKEETKIKSEVDKKHLTNEVFFLGYHPEIYSLMKSCDALVLPSMREGMPNVIFEAMAAGIPVIASDIKANKRWITDGLNALLFQSNSNEDLVKKIRLLISNNELKSRLNKNGAITVQELSISSLVKNYQNLYNKVITENLYGKSKMAM